MQAIATDQIETYNKRYLFTISAVAALGGLLFGYDWVVIGGAKPFYEKFFHLDGPVQQGWAMSCALVGCLLGAVQSGVFTDRLGRKPLLILSALLFAVSSCGTALTNSFTEFVVWRMAGGIAIGLASSLSPLYIAEVSPARFRGKLVALNQLTIVVGVLFAQIVNWLIARPVSPGATAEQILNSWNGQFGWRWMFAATALPAVLFFVGMFFVPESPRWLVAKGAADRAKAIFVRIGGHSYGTQAILEVEAARALDAGKPGLRQLLEARYARPLTLAIGLAVLQQWCGINVIFSYAEEVFSAAGYKVSDILFNIVITGAVNLIFTFLAMGMVDRLGRRALMLSGSAGLALIYILLGATFRLHIYGIYPLLLIVSAIACYAMSLAPVTWVIISEIFPSRIRGSAVSMAVAALWIGSFILTYTFPILNRSLGSSGTFWLYGAICAAGFLFIKVGLPETRGKTLEQIEEIW